ncbi:MAG: hypothetical protein ABIH46_06740 [Chloroflexota bacterium]
MTKQTDAQREGENKEIRALVEEVILNQAAQEQWIDESNELFLDSIDVFSRHIMPLEKKDILRIGVIIGATYERWRQAKKEAEP